MSIRRPVERRIFLFCFCLSCLHTGIRTRQGEDEVNSGSPLSIGACGDLQVMLETLDDYGFDLDEPAVVHYRVRAGEAEISRGSVPLPDTTPFGEQFFWTGNLDLTDAGATTLLPSYMVDIWVSGSDSAGNPFDTTGNSIDEPIASWSLALLGPSIDLNAATSSFSWDDPSQSHNKL